MVFDWISYMAIIADALGALRISAGTFCSDGSHKYVWL